MSAMNQHLPALLIVGASTRAAAQSAVRAGFRPACADLFADEDLRAIAQVLPIADYPHDLPQVARAAPPGPWMYTGALENHPQLVAQIAADRPLWGVPADSLSRVRNPQFIADVLSNVGLPCLPVRPDTDPPPADGSWMLKPLRSAAGRGIRVWNHEARNSATLREPHFFQQRSAGTPLSALFLAERGTSRLLGIARQLIGLESVHTAPFAYCGSVGPIGFPGNSRGSVVASVSDGLEVHPTVGTLQRMGEVLAAACNLRGLFGCDFLDDGRNLGLTEVNPRYTASVEVFEYAWGLPLLGWHARACREFIESPVASAALNEDATVIEPVAETATTFEGCTRIVGKLIVYAPAELTVPAIPEFCVDARTVRQQPFLMPAVADIPTVGSVIEAGRPICTVFARGSTPSECLARLQRNADRILEECSRHAAGRREKTQ
jgi:uncharacterized protein